MLQVLIRSASATYCKTLKFGSSKIWRFLLADLSADLYFGRFFISKKKKKKSVISDVAVCVLCMRVLHSDLRVIHGNFQLFSTLHCSWCMSEYKSVLFTICYLITGLPILLSSQVKPSISYQLYPQFLTITVKKYLLLFSPIVFCHG